MSGPAPIEDRTGLRGKYKFDLTRLGTDGVQSSDWDLAPLGLKLSGVNYSFASGILIVARH
jgi:hypothetical protein